MRTTLNLDDELIAQARDLTGVTEKTALIHAGLGALIERAAAKRLADMGGQFPMKSPLPRRRRSQRTRR
jgi:Arc/MetJ family transcription regulator